jgi:hypothetical protein
MPRRWWEWLFESMYREVWAARKDEDARKAAAKKLREDTEARMRDEYEALDRRMYLRYSHTKGVWIESLSPRQRWLVNRALAVIGSPLRW